ncbi:MAG: glycosyltransferase [Anaerolineales bacterium]
MSRPRVTVFSLSPIAQDARVLRHITYLAQHFDVTAIGYGENPHPNITWRAVRRQRDVYDLGMIGLTLLLGRIWPRVYRLQFLLRHHYRVARRHLVQSQADVIVANEVVEMVLSVQVARQTGVRVIYDAHEYKPAIRAETSWWRWLMAPFFRTLIRQYASQADLMLTTSPEYARWYATEFGLQPALLRNIPALQALPAVTPPPSTFRVVHHGLAAHNRQLENMVDAVKHVYPRFSLALHLVRAPYGAEAYYMDQLLAYISRQAPDAVTVQPPFPPGAIISQLAHYDIGLVTIPPTNQALAGALPNKLFEFIAAGLVVCSGPSPAIAEIVEAYGVGVVAPSFDPQDIAQTLRALTPEDIMRYKSASRRAAQALNADREMQKMIDAVWRLSNPSDE